MRAVPALLVALALLAGCDRDDAPAVRMTSDQRFVPAAIRVEPGATVRFVNDSDEAHTVTAEQRSVPDAARYFSSGGFPSEVAARRNLAQALIAPGDTYEVTLEVPGNYRYVCVPHEEQGMTGSIEVAP